MKSNSHRPQSGMPQNEGKLRPTSATRTTLIPINDKEREVKSGIQKPFSKPPLKGNTQSATKLPPAIRVQNEPNMILQRTNSGDAGQALMNISPAFRLAQPHSSKTDISQKFWMDMNEKGSGLAPNPLTRPISGNSIQMKKTLSGSNLKLKSESSISEIPRIDEYQEEYFGSNKPFSFLSNIGGKTTNFNELTGDGLSSAKGNNEIPSRTLLSGKRVDEKDISLFLNSNVDKPEKLETQPKKIPRPNTVSVTSLMTRTESGTLKSGQRTMVRPTTTQPTVQIPRPITASATASTSMKKSSSAQLRGLSATARNFSGNIMSGSNLRREGEDGKTIQQEYEDAELGIQEDMAEDDEFYIRMETAKNLKTGTLMTKQTSANKFSARPISGRLQAPEEFFANFSKFTNFAELENQYEELFDRNERTLAATYAKFGDLSYFTPTSRIGCFMQYCSKLKQEHLEEVITLMRTVIKHEKVSDFEIPLQLAIIDELNPFQNRQKTGISTTFQAEDLLREPLSLCLYPEYIPPVELSEESFNDLRPGKETASQRAVRIYFEEMLEAMGGRYDPQYMGRNNFIYIPFEEYTREIQNIVKLSFKRYKVFTTSDEHIKHNEIAKYKKDWISNALSLIKDDLLKKHQDLVRKLFQDVFEDYKRAMKEAILNYILLCPQERKRLNIQLIPRPFPSSSERISLEGGFSVRLYPDWHEFIVNARENTVQHLKVMNIVNSAILDWYQDFADLRLFETETFEQGCIRGYAIDFNSFAKIEELVRMKTVSIFTHIFFRGVILILKKSKYFRKKPYTKGKWTYNGFKSIRIRPEYDELFNLQEEMENSNLSFNERFQADKESNQTDAFYNETFWKNLDKDSRFAEGFDFFSDVERIDHLVDIRESPAYRVYSVLTDKPINIEDNLYKSYPKEERKFMRASVGVELKLILRKMIERNVREFEDFFLKRRLLSELEPDLRKRLDVSLHALNDSDNPTPIPEPVDEKLKLNLGTSPKIPIIPHMGISTSGRPHVLSHPSVDKNNLRRPNFMAYQSELFPTFRIEMVLNDGSLKFKEELEFIHTEITEMFKNILISFNTILHPEHTKLEVKTDINTGEEKDPSDKKKQKKAVITETMFQTQKPEEFYAEFCDMIVLKEKAPKSKNQLFNIRPEDVDEQNKIPKYLEILDVEETLFQDIYQRIIDHVESHYDEAQQAFEIFDQFQPFFSRAIEKEVRDLFNHKTFIVDEYKRYLTSLKNFEALLHQVPDNLYFPMFEVNTEKVKGWLLDVIDDNKKKIFHKLELNIIDQLRGISLKYNEIINYARRSTLNPDDVEAMEKFLFDLNTDRVTLKNKASEAFRSFQALLKLDCLGSDELLGLVKEIHDWPNVLDKELKLADDKHTIERSKLEDQLRERRSRFEITINLFLERVDNYINCTEYNKYRMYIQQLDEFDGELETAEKEMLEINDHEKKLFGIVSGFEKFVNLRKRVAPYIELWHTIGEFVDAKKTWINGPILQVKYSEVETITKQHVKTSAKLAKLFLPNSIAGRISQEFRDDVDSINKILSAIEIVTNPGLRGRHWDKIESYIGAKFVPQEGTMIDLLYNKNALEYLPEIEELSDQASKEYKLETMLTKMESEWENLNFVISKWKTSNVSILQGSAIEDIMVLLDDHTVKAQTIRNNPNIKFMEQRAIRWERLMLFIQEVLDLWVKFQSSYLYLEPIFSSDDIKKQMPQEKAKFIDVNATWMDIMASVEKEPLVLNIDKIPDLLPRLNEAIKLIDEIQKGLNDYLETKRLAFPRFFFLSNEDLLNILAETKDPLLVQPHLKKCFEGINELIFNQATEILGMKSPEKEEIEFLDKIAPRDYQSYVELWLLKVEDQMKRSLQKVTDDAFNDLVRKNAKRTDWVRRWPGQAIISVSQTVWTSTVEDRLERYGLQGIEQYDEELQRQLEDIVGLVRGNLKHLEMITLGALIVIEVHARDVVHQLVEDKISDPESFDWLAQMRYYWDSEYRKMHVKMITATLDYGFEYLGNTGRLVITPLTDRCYRTLMSALQLNLGGAPEGPAGTGKTETTKDLAKALAMQCVVFNCSEGLKAHNMAKFFKGLASAGAWSCFDEFNRIELEVLSVIAQQILRIQQAKALQKTTFSFEGTDNLALKKTCNVFITMNPGYAGRSELPDNLKVLFRPVAMMVPDYAMIAEISLYSYGFDKARNLAKKIVATYKLCSEQLSSQSHYDYGMRAVKAVLTTAGQLKRKFVNEKEDILVLRSITDVNRPKFLAHDLPLFAGIISDLFPGVSPPAIEYGVLNETITNAIKAHDLQNIPTFRTKILQLYEMLFSRHGIMLVGQPYSGKTMSYRVLAQAMTEASPEDPNEFPTHYYVINPKSITIPQIYGYSDPISKEWTEGVLAEIYRRCANSTLPDRNWIVFDGPVDADWIENMNTVLDDNKKLCLMNGETIAMSNSMTMMFEVADLLQASPATVSRCGMIYMQPDNIGWWPMVLSWLNQFSDIYDSQIMKHLEDVFDALLGKAIEFIKNKCQEWQSAPEGNLTLSVLKMMKSLIEDHNLTGKDYLNGKPEELMFKLDQCFIYSMLWAVGGVTLQGGRKAFDSFLKKLIVEAVKCDNRKDKVIKFEKGVFPPDTAGSTLFMDYYLENFKWRLWKEMLEKEETEEHLENIPLTDVVVSTLDSIKLTYFLKLAVKNKIPFLTVGPTGTGKSLFLKSYLKSLSPEQYSLIFVTMSAKTTAAQVQRIIDDKLEKVRKGIFGHGFGKHGLIFIDDMNMPGLDKYGAQAPIELVRQFFDHKGWYDLKDKKPKEIINTTIFAAMGPPGGGRNFITSRLLRHFFIFATNESDEKTMQKIFNKVIDLHINRNHLDSDPQKYLKFCIEASTEIYQQISSSLKPTPAKSHYLFNLRDLARVVQGLVLPGKKETGDGKKICRLWMHEVTRVFFDRLVTDQDREIFYNNMVQVVKTKLRESDLKPILKEVIDEKILPSIIGTSETLKHIRFTNIMSEENDFILKPYDEVKSLSVLQAKARQILEEFNSSSKKPMPLILFEFAIDHVLRICRIFKMSKSHALLVGLGGSGRQSLTRLAAYMCEQEIFTVEISKNYTFDMWRSDIKRLIISAGTESKYFVFLITDSQLKETYILEDLNNLLNSGDVPNLLQMDEFIPLIDKLRPMARNQDKEDLYNSGTNAQFYDFFIENVQAHLHCVLVLSSIGSGLRTKIRMFPSLVNCCTIIWYKPWPEEALHAVAKSFVTDIGVEDSLQNGVINICKFMHESVSKLSAEYLRNEGRHNYITPTNYLELLNSIKSLLSVQKNKLVMKRDSYVKGVDKLEQTSESVQIMQEELRLKQPVLQEMKIQNAELAEKIQQSITEMQPKKQMVEEEEAIVSLKFQEAQVIRQACEKELSKAMPLVEKAQKALQLIDANDIIKLKAMLKPPNTVRLVLESVCVLLKRAATQIPNPENPKEKINSYWETSKKVLGEKNFIEQLLEYDIDRIDANLMKKVRADYLSNTAEYNPKRVEKASSAAKGLCEWVIALSEYEKVLAIVRPKQEEFDRASREVESLKKNLKEKTDELNVLKNNLAKLQDQYQETMRKQEELEADIVLCENKLIRAEKLIGSLSGEKIRWSESSELLQQKIKYILGDIIVSGGTISYLGPFNSVYRFRIQKEWTDHAKINGILTSENFNLEAVLGEPIVLRKWTMNGLPSDAFSRENGIIIDKAGRYSLMIDPQNQANKWIKNNELENGLRTIKLSDKDFLRDLENAVQFGWVLLIENVGEQIDPVLEPVLMKQVFKNSGVPSIKIGENIVEYSKTFKLYMTTKLRNPHYPPEISTKITLVNFMITKEGLDDQLLEIAVNKEKPDLEEMRSKLIVQSHDNKNQLDQAEAKILKVLQSSTGNILDDEGAVIMLSESKQIAQDIEEKQQSAEVTERKIEEARQGYKPIAQHSRVLFFSIMSMSNIEVVYQYSLSWFIQLFLYAFDQAEKSEFLLQRVNNVIEYFTYSIYTNVCRSLFEKDKLLFSFNLTYSILESKGLTDPAEYQYFISPSSGVTLEEASPLPWLSNQTWTKVVELSKLNEFFSKLPASIKESSAAWENIFNAQDAHTLQFPEPYSHSNGLQRLCILKALRPDRVIGGIREFVIRAHNSEKFITPPTFDLNKSYSDSVPTQPLIFILPGTDPMSQLLNFVEQHHIKSDNLHIISLGQGQGIHAERAIEESRKLPAWVILQNCHLAPSWMPKLEKICEFLESKKGQEETHPKFRLWLTTYSSENFPVSILQSSVKMTNEPPKGLKNNMLVSYSSDPINNPEFYESNKKPNEFKNLLFGLCMFHAVIQERRTYGPLGWNIMYEFNQSDLRISVRQLHLFLNEYKGIPFNALHYLAGECNYGGRVTDDRDRRILKALMVDFYSELSLKKSHNFMGLKDFSMPESHTFDGVVKHLESWPVVAPPELFGFHSNAEISRDLKETNELLFNLLLIGGGTQNKSKEGDSEEVRLKKICEDLLSKIPKEFNAEVVKAKYEVKYSNSMNTVLGQEIIRYNTLISTITSSLKNTELALKGLQAMSDELEEVTKSLLRGLVPDTWKKRSYPSLKPLGSYILDLCNRLSYFQKWIDNTYPNVYWISGFFFTQSFLTGVLQNYARKYTISIDNLVFDFDFLDQPTDPEKLDLIYKAPEEGAYIHGLYLEGARWDYVNKVLDESKLKVLYTLSPIIWLKPAKTSDIQDYEHYKCPVYKTAERRGVLSTTGHSTNFIMSINMHSDVDESHWIKRGVAMLCQLSD